MKLEGKRILLTGASGGIGEALAMELAAQGAHLLLHGRRAGALERLRKELPHPERHQTVTADLGSPQERARLLQHPALDEGLDVLINGAGCNQFAWLEDQSSEQVERQLLLNVEAPIQLTRALLRLAIGLQSFTSIRAKIFMRVDMFSDREIFRFQDSSKIKNDHVSLVWQPEELYGLVLFEILRNPDGQPALNLLAEQTDTLAALPINGEDSRLHVSKQRRLVHALAGEFMGSNKKRGLVYTWVPLHLSDAANNCSPRTFLAAWKEAAERVPAPADRAPAAGRWCPDRSGLRERIRPGSGSGGRAG